MRGPLRVAAAVALGVGAMWQSTGVAAPKPRVDNVLVILLDTLRAEALTVYGEKKPTSPNIARLAEHALVYDHAWTQYTWTLPSFVSYTTSQYARTHGWDYEIGKFGTYRTVASTVPTVAQQLSTAGWTTAGFYANGHLRSSLGFGEGFQTWKKGTDADVLKWGLNSIGKWASTPGPDLTYVHFMFNHAALKPTQAAQDAIGVDLDYDPAVGMSPKDWFQAPKEQKDAKKQALRDAYLAATWDADIAVGALMAAVQATGMADRTAIVLHADHGELIGEHILWGHNESVYEEVAHVPLIVSVPGIPAARVANRVGQLVDLAPTLLELAGRQDLVPPTWQGVSLLRDSPGRLAVTERLDQIAFTTDGRLKLILDRKTGSFLKAFDLSTDPGEMRSLAESSPGVGALLTQARDWLTKVPSGTNTGIAPVETAEEQQSIDAMLKELGYQE